MAKNLNTPWRWSVAGLFVVGVYFSITWFFFGSSHPCGILEARQKPYAVQRYIEDAVAWRSSLFKSYMVEQEWYAEMLMRGNLEKGTAAINEEIHKESQKQYDKASQDVSDAQKEQFMICTREFGITTLQRSAFGKHSLGTLIRIRGLHL
ncbi:MAG: hypothetical protein HY695_12910 [Deltaproteobacteria bacterium]|nr:hypothetical protein [Deltaproteobacteria bacterium]